MHDNGNSRIACINHVVARLGERGGEAVAKAKAEGAQGKTDMACVAMALATVANMFALPSGVEMVMGGALSQLALDAALRELHLAGKPWGGSHGSQRGTRAQSGSLLNSILYILYKIYKIQRQHRQTLPSLLPLSPPCDPIYYYG